MMKILQFSRTPAPGSPPQPPGKNRFSTRSRNPLFSAPLAPLFRGVLSALPQRQPAFRQDCRLAFTGPLAGPPEAGRRSAVRGADCHGLARGWLASSPK